MILVILSENDDIEMLSQCRHYALDYFHAKRLPVVQIAEAEKGQLKCLLVVIYKWNMNYLCYYILAILFVHMSSK